MAASSQPDRPGVSRSDHSADTKILALWRALGRGFGLTRVALGVGKRKKEGKEGSRRGSQDEPAQHIEENGS